jgi:hypothetical protein
VDSSVGTYGKMDHAHVWMARLRQPQDADCVTPKLVDDLLCRLLVAPRLCHNYFAQGPNVAYVFVPGGVVVVVGILSGILGLDILQKPVPMIEDGLDRGLEPERLEHRVYRHVLGTLRVRIGYASRRSRAITYRAFEYTREPAGAFFRRVGVRVLAVNTKVAPYLPVNVEPAGYGPTTYHQA